jgi:hypothetical protein
VNAEVGFRIWHTLLAISFDLEQRMSHRNNNDKNGHYSHRVMPILNRTFAELKSDIPKDKQMLFNVK